MNIDPSDHSIQAEIDRERENEARNYVWREHKLDFIDWLRDGEFDLLPPNLRDGPDPMTVADWCSQCMVNAGDFPFGGLLIALTSRDMAIAHRYQDLVMEYIAGQYADWMMENA